MFLVRIVGRPWGRRRLAQHFGSTGPVYGNGDVPLSHARDELLRLLRERGARSALVAYEGGSDEGWITLFEVSPAPLDRHPKDVGVDALPAGRPVDLGAPFT